MTIKKNTTTAFCNDIKYSQQHVYLHSKFYNINDNLVRL